MRFSKIAPFHNSVVHQPERTSLLRVFCAFFTPKKLFLRDM